MSSAGVYFEDAGRKLLGDGTSGRLKEREAESSGPAGNRKVCRRIPNLFSIVLNPES
jgi:hypothetical protein